MESFLSLLCSDERGLCFACNIVDSVQQDLFSVDRLRRLLHVVSVEYRADPASVPTSAHAIGLVYRVASGFSSRHGERHVMAAQILRPTREGRLAYALRWRTLVRWTQGVADPHLRLRATPPNTTGDARVSRRRIDALNNEIQKDATRVFAAEATLGYTDAAACRIGLAWYTRKDDVDSFLSSADDLRDCLGMDSGKDTYQVVATFDDTEVHKGKVARPTFADGGNTRFRVMPDRPGVSAWGTTVDLGKLFRGDPDIDGVPERVADPVALRLLKPQFAPVGVVSRERGSDATDCDAAFLARVLRGRTALDIGETLRGWLL